MSISGNLKPVAKLGNPAFKVANVLRLPSISYFGFRWVYSKSSDVTTSLGLFKYFEILSRKVENDKKSKTLVSFI